MANQKPEKENSAIILTEFDARTIGTGLQMIKAIIPFLDVKEQKMFGLMIRIMEFNMTLDFFNKNRLPFCTFKSGDSGQLFNEIKKYCAPEERKQLEMMLGMMKMQQMQNASSPVDLMSGILTPEQMKMYREYEKML